MTGAACHAVTPGETRRGYYVALYMATEIRLTDV